MTEAGKSKVTLEIGPDTVYKTQIVANPWQCFSVYPSVTSNIYT